MQLPLIKSTIKELQSLITQWKGILDPALANPLLTANQLDGIILSSGSNTINHKLGRTPQGYIITGMSQAFAQIYSSPSSNPTLTLVLNSSGSTVINLMVY